MAKKVDYEARFYAALKRITIYDPPAYLRKSSEMAYGLDHAEALEMAYENVIREAKAALCGYRRPSAKVGTGNPASTEVLGSVPSEAQK